MKGSMKNLFHRETLKKEAVKDISFQVEKGEILALLGPQRGGQDHDPEDAFRNSVSDCRTGRDRRLYPMGEEKRVQTPVLHRHGPEKTSSGGICRPATAFI